MGKVMPLEIVELSTKKALAVMTAGTQATQETGPTEQPLAVVEEEKKNSRFVTKPSLKQVCEESSKWLWLCFYGEALAKRPFVLRSLTYLAFPLILLLIAVAEIFIFIGCGFWSNM